MSKFTSRIWVFLVFRPPCQSPMICDKSDSGCYWGYYPHRSRELVSPVYAGFVMKTWLEPKKNAERWSGSSFCSSWTLHWLVQRSSRPACLHVVIEARCHVLPTARPTTQLCHHPEDGSQVLSNFFLYQKWSR